MRLQTVRIIKLACALFCFCACIVALPSTSHSATDDELLRVVRSLEARVNALEAENKKIKSEAQRHKRAAAQVQERKDAALQSPLSSAYASSPVSPVGRENSWSGAYFGASFGAASTQSRVHSTERVALTSANPPPNDLTGNNATSDGRGSGYGANIDLFLGVNTYVAPDVIAGVQFEGTISDYTFASNGSRYFDYFDSNGPTALTATSNFRNSARARWMSSALARAGVLTGPDTLIYGIAGWTLAGFDFETLSTNSFYERQNRFLTNGPTAGAGVEQKLANNWSVRLEYRYTHFLPTNIQSEFVFSTNQPSAQTSTINGRFENSMHIGRIGVAYQLPVGR